MIEITESLKTSFGSARQWEQFLFYGLSELDAVRVHIAFGDAVCLVIRPEEVPTLPRQAPVLVGYPVGAVVRVMDDKGYVHDNLGDTIHSMWFDSKLYKKACNERGVWSYYNPRPRSKVFGLKGGT